jgi:hypothetical protein
MTFSNVRVSCRHGHFRCQFCYAHRVSIRCLRPYCLSMKRDLISYWSATVSEIEIEIRIQMMRNGFGQQPAVMASVLSGDASGDCP